MGPVLKATIIEAFVGIIDDKVYTTEVVGGFDDIVNIDTLIGNADGVGLKYVASLIMSETATFDKDNRAARRVALFFFCNKTFTLNP